MLRLASVRVPGCTLRMTADRLGLANATFDTANSDLLLHLTRFLLDLPQVQTVVLHTLIVDDLDYSPLLHLSRMQSSRVMKVRGMQPEHGETRRFPSPHENPRPF